MNIFLSKFIWAGSLLTCLSLFNCVDSKAVDDVIPVANIIAGDSYSGLTPRNLISMEGMEPNPTIDLENTTHRMIGLNCWHTSGDDNTKAWLLVDLGKALPVSKLYVWNLNQGGHPDRDIKDVEISYSVDSENGQDGTWIPLGSFVFSQSEGNAVACNYQSIVDFNVTARFVRIEAKSSYGSQYWGLGQLVFLQDHSQDSHPEILELKGMFMMAKARKFYDYTDGSWSLLNIAINNAEELLNSGSEDIPALTAAIQALTNATATLQTKSNLIAGANATANVFYGEGYEGKNVVDGRFDTRWASPLGGEYWLQIDLGSEKTWNQVCIFETQNYAGRIQKSVISVSSDGQSWTPWSERESGRYYVSVVGEPVTARYLKIDFPNGSSEGINVDEVMIFNDHSALESNGPSALRPEEEDWVKQEPATTPNIYQIRKADLKYGMFIHYGMNTFVGEEWTDGSFPPSTYNPNSATLDPESWVKAAYEGGMNFVVLTAKHHDGFAIWNTAIGTYNINHTGRANEMDIVKAVSDACKKYGIKMGLYYSAWDRNWDANNTQTTTGLDRVALYQAYNDFAMAQVTELLDGSYGEISEFWIDGAWIKKNEEWEFARLYNTVKTLQPACQFGVNITIEKITPDQAKGGENIYFFPSDFRLFDPLFTKPGPDADPKVYSHDGQSYYLPFEATICINNSWFWNANQNAGSVKSSSEIRKAYNHMAEQGNTFVLNLSPNSNGVLNDFDVTGLYAGARALGIARDGARSNIEADECIVEIRYTTDKGHIAYPTKLLYGKEGIGYNVMPDNLEHVGYRFISNSNNTTGVFNKEKITIELMYQDVGNQGSPVPIAETKAGSSQVYVRKDHAYVSCDTPSQVFIYNILGDLVEKMKVDELNAEIPVPKNLQGFHIFKFVSEDSSMQIVKVYI